MPIKCPVAPLEFTFLADWYLSERGIRDRTELVYVTSARRRVHQARPHRSMLSGLLAVEGRRGGHGVQRRRGRRGRRHAQQLRRARAAVRPARDDPAARRRRVHRPLARPRRRHRLRADRPAHAAVEGGAERVRDRRRDEPADLEGGLGHALRGRHAHRERPAVPRTACRSRARSTATRTASSRRGSGRRC